MVRSGSFDDEDSLNVTGLVKSNERYILIYSDSHRLDAMRVLGRWAANPDLSFTWFDAALIHQRISEAAHGHVATDTHE